MVIYLNKSEYFCIKSREKYRWGSLLLASLFFMFIIHISKLSEVSDRQVWETNEDPDQTAP